MHSEYGLTVLVSNSTPLKGIQINRAIAGAQQGDIIQNGRNLMGIWLFFRRGDLMTPTLLNETVVNIGSLFY